MTTSRTDFNESWLAEMPMGTGKMGNNFYNNVVSSIRDFITHGVEPSDLGNGFKKIQGQQVAYYWHEHNGTITIAAEFSVKPQALIVNGVAKNPSTNTTVHATELYDLVLKDNHKSIKLMSDDKLSDDGYKLWKRLLQMGHAISVYDNHNPGQTLQTLKSVEDMEQFFKVNDSSARRWQYVLSEQGVKLGETRSFFNTRRMRELCGMGLTDYNGVKE